MKRVLGCLLLLALVGQAACAETAEPAPGHKNEAVYALNTADTSSSEEIYTLVDEKGRELTQYGGKLYPDDEYISSDDVLYRVVAVDDENRVAHAETLGPAVKAGGQTETAFATGQWDGPTVAAFQAFVAQAGEGRLICMYSTHSDESYEPTDGTSSKLEDAGIFDVGRALAGELEERGISVVYSEDTFYPHDAQAYTRSRRTAEELIEKAPDALFDVHRDAIPESQYKTTIEGEDASKIRLFVGRTNPNSAANRAFAQQLKATADKEYPGLVKDIFIGKGNYNQELYPRALLLEMGTHEMDKDLVITSTGYLADVIEQTLYGPTAKAADKAEEKGAGKGIVWIVIGAVVLAVVYGLFATGSLKKAFRKAGRSASEMTGGLIGKKPEEDLQKRVGKDGH